MMSKAPEFIRIIVHRVTDRRGRQQLLATIAGRMLCLSQNPIICAAPALFDEGHAPSTQVIFQDAELGIEEAITLAEAAEWRMAELGDVVPLRSGRQQ
jgi:hypothetical protein